MKFRREDIDALSGGEDLALLVERWYRPFFRQTRELLDRLQEADGDSYGGLSDVLDLLERKRVEQDLVISRALVEMFRVDDLAQRLALQVHVPEHVTFCRAIRSPE